MKHILMIEELRLIGRPIGKSVPDVKLEAFLTEAEQLHVKPVLGDALFGKLTNDEARENADMQMLLNGGSYDGECGGYKSFMGLKQALSYFVNAQNIMSGDFTSTAYGMVRKDGDYSTPISSKERSEAYNNVLEVANAYLQDCVTFAKAKGLIKGVGKKRYSMGGVTIRRIG